MAMQDNAAPTQLRPLPARVFVGFLVGRLMAFLLGNHWYSLVPTNDSTLYKWGIAVVFLVFSLAMRHDARSVCRPDGIRQHPFSCGPWIGPSGGECSAYSPGQVS